MEKLNKFIHDNEDNGSHYYPWLISLYNKVIDIKPNKILELGTGSGSTSITMAKALYDLNNRGSIITSDRQPRENFNKILSLYEKNFNELYSIIDYNYGVDVGDNYKFDSDFDLLYMDIDNTGKKIEHLLKQLNLNGIYNKHIIFEGGSNERDMLSHMVHDDNSSHPHLEHGVCGCEYTKDTIFKSIVRLKDKIKYEVLDETFSSVSYFFASEDIVKQFT